MSSPVPLYNDPTFDATLQRQIFERGCAVCVHADVVHVCKHHLRFPACRSDHNGFALEDDGVDE